MPNPSEAISAYIHAKDCNRPWLIGRSFAEDAVAAIVNRTDAIAFPGEIAGRDNLIDALLRRFALEFENVFTFCLCPPPLRRAPRFSCDWLVGMSVRATGEIRVGAGRYDWEFNAAGLVERVAITIETMQAVPPTELDAIMSWLADLPCPWCPAEAALARAPAIPALAAVNDYIAVTERRYSEL